MSWSIPACSLPIWGLVDILSSGMGLGVVALVADFLPVIFGEITPPVFVLGSKSVDARSLFRTGKIRVNLGSPIIPVFSRMQQMTYQSLLGNCPPRLLCHPPGTLTLNGLVMGVLSLNSSPFHSGRSISFPSIFPLNISRVPSR